MELATFVHLLRRCRSTKSVLEGMRLHSDIVGNSFYEQDCNVGNGLVQMYGECGSLEDAIHVFAHMPDVNIFSWSILIKVLVENDKCLEGFQNFQQMELEGTIANNVSFITILSGFNNQTMLKEGKRFHARISETAWDTNVVVSTCLINMYNKCECVDDAWKVFDKMAERNEISWNVIIVGHIRTGRSKAALKLFEQMLLECSLPTKATFVSVLGAYDDLMRHFKELKQIHARVSASTSEGYDVVLGTVLVKMYAKVGILDEASKVFGMISERNSVTWNAIIGATFEHGQGYEALGLFQRMFLEGNILDRFNLATALSACASQDTLTQGRHVHALIAGCELQSDLIVGNGLLNFYGKCGTLKDVRLLFTQMPCRDTVSYNSVLAAFTQQEQNEDALQLFYQMRLEGVLPDKVRLATLLTACTYEETFTEGMRVHAIIEAKELSSDNFLSASLVSMYGKNSDLESALEVLNRSDNGDVVVWTAMISACAQHGLTERAFCLYQQMQVEGVIPNKASVISVLDACASQTDLDEGKRLHACTIAHDMVSQIFVRNAVINMYIKCGNLKEAWNTFRGMLKRNVVTWTAIISGFARLGHGLETHSLFQAMRNEGVSPNKVTLISIIDACSHAGLVDEASYYFACICEEYIIDRTIEHYTSMIDLLGRAGRLCEAEALILCAPLAAPLPWLALLNGCRIHLDVTRAHRAAQRIIGLDPTNDAPYDTLSHIYAALGEWEEVVKLRMVAKYANQSNGYV